MKHKIFQLRASQEKKRKSLATWQFFVFFCVAFSSIKNSTKEIKFVVKKMKNEMLQLFDRSRGKVNEG